MAWVFGCEILLVYLSSLQAIKLNVCFGGLLRQSLNTYQCQQMKLQATITVTFHSWTSCLILHIISTVLTSKLTCDKNIGTRPPLGRTLL